MEKQRKYKTKSKKLGRLEEIVEISGAPQYNILRHLIEKEKNEAIGDLIGKKSGHRYILVNAYPWVTAKTNHEEAGYGDYFARRRILQMDKTLKNNGSNHSLIGNYHTQVYSEDEQRGYISDKDKIFFRQGMKMFGLKESIQIVASVRIRNYKEKRDQEMKLKNYAKKLRIIFNAGDFSYDVILAAYKLTQKTCKEIPIKRRKIKGVRLKHQ